MGNEKFSRSVSFPVRKQGSILVKTKTAPPRLGTQPQSTVPVPVHSHRNKLGAAFIALVLIVVGSLLYYWNRGTTTSSDKDNCDSIENGSFIQRKKRPRKMIDINRSMYRCNKGYKYANNIPSPTNTYDKVDCKTGTLKGLCVPTVTPPAPSYCSPSSTFEWNGPSPEYGETAFPSSRIRCIGGNPTPSPGHPFFTCQRNGVIKPTPCVPTRSTSGYTNYIDQIIDWISGRPDINQHSKYSLLPGYLN